MICQFIGAQAWVDTDKTGGRNPLVDAAMEINIFGGGGSPQLDALRGDKVADRVEDDPRLQTERPVAADPAAGVEAVNPDGSFEALARLFGGGVKPAMPGMGEQVNGSG